MSAYPKKISKAYTTAAVASLKPTKSFDAWKKREPADLFDEILRGRPKSPDIFTRPYDRPIVRPHPMTDHPLKTPKPTVRRTKTPPVSVTDVIPVGNGALYFMTFLKRLLPPTATDPIKRWVFTATTLDIYCLDGHDKGEEMVYSLPLPEVQSAWRRFLDDE